MKRRRFIKAVGVGLAGFPALSSMTYSQEAHIVNYQNKIDMNPRLRTFDLPHKGIRNGFSQFSLLAGKTNYGDRIEVERLNEVGKEVFLLLNTHAQDENDVSLMHLEKKMKGASHHDMEEHARLHAMQSRLENMLNEIHAFAREGVDATERGMELYTSLADYHSEYLNHMSEEERVTQQLLWDHFTDEELMGHRTEIMKNLPPDTLLLWLKYVAPAQSHQERVGLFSGFKRMAPAELFEKAKEVLKTSLDASEFKKLMNEL